MRKAILFTGISVILGVAALLIVFREPTVRRSSLAIDTVARGDLVVSVRGPGIITSPSSANLTVPEADTTLVAPGQKVVLSSSRGSNLTGRVQAVDRVPVKRQVTIMVALDQDGQTKSVPIQSTVIGTIQVTELRDVLRVGRPVFAKPNAEAIIFRTSADGHRATRVTVLYGQNSFNEVEIRRGLQPGDSVILSDMSAYKRHHSVRLE